MNNAFISKTLAAFTIATIVVGTSLPAHADDVNFNDRVTMAYGSQEDSADTRFDQFELHGDYDDAHELNDAWLGMPVRDSGGKVIGVVEDAFLDDEGYLTELLVAINGSSVSVFVDQKNVEYTEVAVLVDLPLRTIASLQQPKKRFLSN